MILVLNLVLLSAGFSQSTDPRNLKCFNDYDTEMSCHLDLDNCTEHKLSVSLLIKDRTQWFACSFQLVSPGNCECKFQVPGFVLGETFNASLWKGEKILFDKVVDTEETIKPKKPINITVNMNENGNFLITWINNYTSLSHKPFVESLSTVLEYTLKEIKHGEIIEMEKGRTDYEIVGKKLQPNSVYVVTVKVRSDYNPTVFSDYTEPYEFSTPSSLQNIFKIIIPFSCIILILFIVSIFYCYIKIMKQWWNKIPTPKIAPSFEKPVLHWDTFQNNFSQVFLESSKLEPFKDKTWISRSLIDVGCENSLNSVGKSGDTSHVSYAQTGSEEVEEGLLGNDGYQSTDHSLPTLASGKVDNNQRASSGNSSCFSNRCYLGSDSSRSSFLNRTVVHSAYPHDGSENPFSEKLDPVIPTDFEYGPCNGCSRSTDLTLSQNMSSNTDTVVIFGYQSVNDLPNNENRPEVVAEESVDQEFISYHNDVNLKVKPVCFNNPVDFPFPGCESNIIIPVDEGYQSCPGLNQNRWSSDQSTELEQSISQAITETEHHNMGLSCQEVHAPSFKGLCGPALHVSPGIQIDCSYQRV